MLIKSLLNNYNIPFEKLGQYYEEIYCIPNRDNPVVIITNYEIEYTLWLDDVTEDEPLTGLTEREALEYTILYLLQRHTKLVERVPFTALHKEDPEYLITRLIEEGAENDETPDQIANKILTHGLIFNVREMISSAAKELDDYNKMASETAKEFVDYYEY